MNENDELLDIVNADDAVIGTIQRSEYNRLVREQLGWLRAIDVFIINSKRELWIPTRTADKTIAPNGLDYSCGGHVSSGENYLECALREIDEELNLQLAETDLEFVKKFRDDDIRYMRSVYVVHSDNTPDYNPDDFVSAEWMGAEDLLTKLESGVPAKVSIHGTVTELIRLGYC